MRRLGAQTAVKRKGAGRDAARRHFRELFNQGGEIGFLRQRAGLHLLTQYAGLVRQNRGFINGARRFRKQGKLLVQYTPRLGGGELGMCGIKAVEGVLAVPSTAADADNAAALGHHGRVVDGLGAL